MTDFYDQLIFNSFQRGGVWPQIQKSLNHYKSQLPFICRKEKSFIHLYTNRKPVAIALQLQHRTHQLVTVVPDLKELFSVHRHIKRFSYVTHNVPQTRQITKSGRTNRKINEQIIKKQTKSHTLPSASQPGQDSLCLSDCHLAHTKQSYHKQTNKYARFHVIASNSCTNQNQNNIQTWPLTRNRNRNRGRHLVSKALLPRERQLQSQRDYVWVKRVLLWHCSLLRADR